MFTHDRDHRHQRLGCLLGATVGLAVLSATCARESGGPERPAGDSGPVAGSPEKIASAPAQAQADSTSCLSCHENFRDEVISIVHGRHGTSCTGCHGQSAAHVAGGSPQPEPDHVYAGAEIDKKCTECHQRHSPAMIERVVKRREGRKSPHGQPITTESTCTDCHGRHVRAG